MAATAQLPGRTGGTAAPGTKIPAAPAPIHVPGTHNPTNPKLPANKSLGSKTKAAANTRAKATTPRRTTTTKTTTTKAPAVEKPWYEQGQGKVDKLVENSVNSSEKAEETPYKNRLTELGQIKAEQQNKYANVGKEATNTLTALRGTDEASAKTGENEAAEHAQAALAQLPTAGPGATQNEIGQNVAERQAQESLAANREQTAQKVGGSESEYLNKLQGIAQLRGTEGAANIGAKVSTEEGTENSRLASIKAAKTGEISAEELKLLPEATKDKIAAEELGLKNKTQTAREKETERKTTVTQTNNETKNKQSAEKLQITRKEATRKQEETNAKIQYEQGSQQDKEAADRTKQEEANAKIKNYEAKTHQLTTSGTLSKVQGEVVDEISKAATLAKMWKEQGKLSNAQIHEELLRGSNVKVKSALFVTAAIEAVEKGYLSAKTKSALVKAGQLPENFQLSNYIFG